MRTTSSRARRGERGSALLLAITLILAITVIGTLILRVTGEDRIAAGKLGIRERAQACAEAGIQYGRRMFGTRYETSNGWNDLLDNTAGNYRYDPLHLSTDRALSPKVAAATGADDARARIDGDSGDPDFWVSIRDDDDEAPLGPADVRTRDNNEVVILRSECVNPFLEVEQGGQKTHVVIEVLLAHVQGSSGYGNAQITSNSPDVVGTR